MAKAHTFILSDESVVNSYGIRVMTAGIDIKQYKRNPVVLWYHKRPSTWSKENPESEPLPIGKAVKLWKEDGMLYADVEFDQEDDFAKKIEGKIERGFINMCSPGLDPITISEDAKYLLAGQTRSTLVKSELSELSIVDIGSNKNALKLNLGDDDLDGMFPLLLKKDTNNQTKMDEFKQRVAKLLDLDPNASDDSIHTAITTQLKLAKQVPGLKEQNQTLSHSVEEINQARIIALVDAGQDKKFTADKRETFLKLGKDSGIDALKNVLEAMPEMARPSDAITPGNTSNTSGSAGGDTTFTFAKLREQGQPAVEKYKKEKPQEYLSLFKAEYGFEPEMD